MSPGRPPARLAGGGATTTPRTWWRAESWALVPAGLFLFVLPINHTMAVRMLCLTLALIGAVWWAWTRGMPRPPLRAALAAWVGLPLLSLAWSANPAFSIAEIKSEIGYGLATLFVFFVLTHNVRTWRLWQHLAIASLAVTMVLGIPQCLRVYPDYCSWYVVHGYASYSTYLATVAPVLLLWLTNSRPRLQAAGALIGIAWVATGYLLANRMLWVSLALVLLGHAWMLRKRFPEARSTHRWLISAIAGTALCAVLFVLVAQHKLVDYTDTARAESSESHVVNTVVASERRYIWAYWLARIGEHPLTGVGFGRDLPHWVYAKPAEWPDSYFAHAHNVVLDYGLQMGVPGMAVLVVLMFAMAREFWRFTVSQSDDVRRAGMAGIGILVAMLSKNLVDDLFWRTDALVFWAFVGMILGLGSRTAARPVNTHAWPPSP